MFGKDRLFWLIPTHPCLRLNYLERLYTRNQIKQIVRQKIEFEEHEWDINKKFYVHELRKSNREKTIFFGLLLMGVCLLVYYVALVKQNMVTQL